MIPMSAKRIVERLTDELHWTVEEVGVKTGASSDMVRRWKRGENEPTGIRKQKLFQLAEKHLTNGEIVTAR